MSEQMTRDGEGEKEKILKIQASLLITQSWNRNSEKHHFCHIPFIHSEPVNPVNA